MNDINILRKEIDRLDKDIIKLLNERYTYTDKIGVLKKLEQKKVLDNSREEVILNIIEEIADQENIEDIKSVYRYIMKISKKRQINE